MGRNPPKNLSTSLKSYLKKSDPVKLARAKERVRQERAIEKSLERFESQAIPEVPTAQEEVQEIIQEVINTTGQLPSDQEVENIKVNVIQERRKRGVQAGSKRGPYLGKLEGQDIDRTMAQKKLIKGMKALFANVDRSKFNRAYRAQQGLRPQISIAQQSPTESGVVVDPFSGQVYQVPTVQAPLLHPQTGQIIDSSSSYGRFLLKAQQGDV